MWLHVVFGVVDLGGDGRLVEHGEVPGEEVDEGQGGGGEGFLDGGEDEGGYLVADAGLAAGADYYGDGEGGHLLVSGVEAEVEDNLDVGRCL